MLCCVLNFAPTIRVRNSYIFHSNITGRGRKHPPLNISAWIPQSYELNQYFRISSLASTTGGKGVRKNHRLHLVILFLKHPPGDFKNKNWQAVMFMGRTLVLLCALLATAESSSAQIGDRCFWFQITKLDSLKLPYWQIVKKKDCIFRFWCMSGSWAVFSYSLFVGWHFSLFVLGYCFMRHFCRAITAIVSIVVAFKWHFIFVFGIWYLQDWQRNGAI